MCRLLTRAAALLLLAFVTQLWYVSPATAQENAARSIDFEGQPDGNVIGDRISGLRFEGDTRPWRFADVRTGRYNAPYPADCPAFGVECAYVVSGSGFAWLGAGGGSGTIRFGSAAMPVEARVFAADFSTSGPLTVRALAADGSTISSQAVAPNIRTGRLDTVHFSEPGITAVRVEGATNGWIMDNLHVVAPTSPLESNSLLSPSAHPAQVTVVQHAAASETLGRGSELMLTVVVTNHGRGPASDTHVTLPLDNSQLRLLDARFSRQTAWVSHIHGDAVEIRTGRLSSRGDTITATLRLEIALTAQDRSILGERLRYEWRDRAEGGAGTSNRLDLAVGKPVLPAATLVRAHQADQLGAEGYTADTFAPGEPVALWYHTPAGTVIAHGRITADHHGMIRVDIQTAVLERGSYLLVATGIWSGQVASAHFLLP
jgi:hypothetical protein